MYKSETIQYNIQNFKIKLKKDTVVCKATIFVDMNTIELNKQYCFADKNGTLEICIKSLEGLAIKNNILKLSKNKTFNVKWRKKDYKELPNYYVFTILNDNMDIVLSVPKPKYSPDNWYASYTSYKKRMKEELSTYSKRVGKVKSNYNIDYSNTNIHKPFRGGGCSGK